MLPEVMKKQFQPYGHLLIILKLYPDLAAKADRDEATIRSQEIIAAYC